MSYSVMFFAVDTDRVNNLIGSNDTALLEAVLQSQAEDIEDHDESWIDDFEEDEFLPTADAIRQIFSGSIDCPDGMEFQFAYGFKYVCQHLGDMIPGSGEIYDTRELGFNSQLMSNGVPVNIPVPAGDFPEIGHLTPAQVSTELSAAMSVARPGEDLITYISVLEHAKSKGKGIIAFRH